MLGVALALQLIVAAGDARAGFHVADGLSLDQPNVLSPTVSPEVTPVGTDTPSTAAGDLPRAHRSGMAATFGASAAGALVGQLIVAGAGLVLVEPFVRHEANGLFGGSGSDLLLAALMFGAVTALELVLPPVLAVAGARRALGSTDMNRAGTIAVATHLAMLAAGIYAAAKVDLATGIGVLAAGDLVLLPAAVVWAARPLPEPVAMALPVRDPARALR